MKTQDNVINLFLELQKFAVENIAGNQTTSDLDEKFNLILHELNVCQKQFVAQSKKIRKLQELHAQEVQRRKTSEALLGIENEILDVTLGNIREGVIATDENGNVILMNKVAEELTGRRIAESRGKSYGKVVELIDETTRKIKQNPLEKVLETGALNELSNHTILKGRKKKERVVEHTAVPLLDENENVDGAVLVIRDVTEAKKFEEERLKANKLEAIGFLAGGIAHDFNNLLTAIWGNISLAKMLLGNSEIVDILSNAESASKRAKNLTNQLLTFAKGGMPIKKAMTIPRFIEESVGFITRGVNVQCGFKFSKNLYPVEIDEDQINQVINNLIINSIQAMPQGGKIKITGKNSVLFEDDFLPLLPGKYIKLSFTDTGCGINEQNLNKIFDPYFTTKQFGTQRGCGLGLATSYSIIKKHGGLITVNSKLGAGTTFFIYLPASSETIPKEDTASPKKIRTGTGRILIMEDEFMLCDFSQKVLSQLGYSVETVSNGEEAVWLYREAQKENPFDAVILNLIVPGFMGAKETIGKIKEFDPNVKAIVTSGYSNDPIMADCEKYGARAVLNKPYDLDDLSKVLDKVFSE